MGQTNTKRISHTLENLPNTFRDDQLRQILDDMNEEETGRGFSEASYIASTPFVQQIITYKDNTKTQKRTQIDFTYAPLPFVSTVVKQIFDQDDDSITVATISATVNYNANKTVRDVDVTTTRP